MEDVDEIKIVELSTGEKLRVRDDKLLMSLLEWDYKSKVHIIKYNSDAGKYEYDVKSGKEIIAEMKSQIWRR